MVDTVETTTETAKATAPKAAATAKKTTARKPAAKKPAAKATAKKTTAKTAAKKPAAKAAAKKETTQIDKIRTQVEDVVDTVRDAAKETVEILNKSRDAAVKGTRAANLKLVDFAEKNTKDGFAVARKVLKADTPRAALDLQTEFVRQSVKTYGEQARTIGNMYADAAKKTVAPITDGAKEVADKVREIAA